MIDFEEELSRFKPSLEIEVVEDAIVKSDLTDMTDIMMELIKERKEEKHGLYKKMPPDFQQFL